MRTHRESNNPLQPVNTSSTASYLNTFLHNTAWLMPHYSGVPHLRGNALSGRLPYIKDPVGLLETIKEAGKLAEESRAGMCTFWVNDKLILLLAEPEYVYDFKMHHYKNMETSVSNWDTYPGPSALNDPKQGLLVRRAYHDTLFKTQPLNQLQIEITKTISEYLGNIRETKSYQITDANRHFKKFALELTAKLFMGISNFTKFDSDALLNFLADAFSGYNNEDSLYLEMFGITEPHAKLQQFKKDMQANLASLLLKKHQTEITGSDNLLFKLWQLGSFKDENNLSIDNFFPDAFFFLAGGLVNATSDSIQTIISLLNQHPAVAKKLQKELLALPEDQLKSDVVNRLPYLDKVIKEAYRIAPPFPILPARPAKDDFQFHGVKIKTGDCILISPYVCHHSANSWDNPETFDPERFDRDNSSRIPKGAYIPFGLGERDCIGKRYGLALIKMFIAKLYYEFSVTVEYNVDNQQKERMQLTLQPRPHNMKEPMCSNRLSPK